jgi:hypothetical protein
VVKSFGRVVPDAKGNNNNAAGGGSDYGTVEYVPEPPVRSLEEAIEANRASTTGGGGKGGGQSKGAEELYAAPTALATADAAASSVYEVGSGGGRGAAGALYELPFARTLGGSNPPPPVLMQNGGLISTGPLEGNAEETYGTFADDLVGGGGA